MLKPYRKFMQHLKTRRCRMVFFLTLRKSDQLIYGFDELFSELFRYQNENLE